MKFSTSHEWVKIEKKIATIGISKEAIHLIGDIVYVDLPSVGKRVKREEAVCLIEASKAASDIYSPLSGVVVAINRDLLTEPSLIHTSPENQGWLYKLRIDNREEYDLLMKEEEYQNYLHA